VLEETLCDNKDNDCDGLTDEPYTQENGLILGAVCNNGLIGGCFHEGEVRCKAKPLPGDHVVCCEASGGDPCTVPIAADPDQLEEPEGSDADGVDNDCDGYTDEGTTNCTENLITVEGDGFQYDIFAYEASHVALDGDKQSPIACSQPDEFPWTMVDWIGADSACDALNDPDDNCTDGVDCWTLCSVDQWEFACAFGKPVETAPHKYPYDDTLYQPLICNGMDRYQNEDKLVGCGVETFCFSDWDAAPNTTHTKVYDLSGNAEEWTGTERLIGQPPNTTTLYEIRGGSYNDQGGGLTCDFDFWAATDDFLMPNLGFRCCRGPEPEIPDPCQDAIDAIQYHPFDFEGVPCSTDGWELTNDWQLGTDTNPVPHGGSCEIGTVLGGNYHNSTTSYATSALNGMPLSDCSGQVVTLRWYMWRQIGNGDTLYLDVYSNGAWTNGVQSYTGNNAAWNLYTADVSNYMSDDFRVRFRFTANGWGVARGPYFDDLSIQNQ
jgi:hypothetical protein